MLAVRSFSSNRYDHKPASKLFNAWKAGVPAILGCESAFQAERKGDLDYVEVSSMETLIQAITDLRNDDPLRQAIARNGKTRAKEVEPSRITEKWIDFLVNEATPAYHQWCAAAPFSQKASLTSSRITYYFWRAWKLWKDSRRP